MVKKAITSLILAAGLALPFMPNAAAVSVNMAIDENEVIRIADPELYGINCEWSVGVNDNYLDSTEDGIILSPTFKDAWQDTFTFGRMAGCSSQDFIWKDALGPFEGRKNQTMWTLTDKVYAGIIEWLQSIYSVNPDAKICYTVNMCTDSVENIADLAEFLLGDGTVNYNGGENWANVRKSLGIENPVNVYTWELGNELDWSEEPRWKVEEYIEYCKKIIPVIRAIDPDANITCFANTAAHANGDGWEHWHRSVLKELGSQIEMLAFHYYYPAGYVRRADVVLDRMEKDIIDITGSDRIKIYISEQAPAPNVYTYNKEKPYDYCLPHTIWGATALSEFYLRLLLRPSVIATTCHSIDSAVWTIVYRDENGKHTRSAVGDVINSFARFGVGDVLKSELDTYSKDQSSDIAAAAVRDKDGNINILFANRSEKNSTTVKFSFKNGNYRIKSVRRIHGDVKSADNWYRKGSQWEYNNPDRVSVTEQSFESDSAILSYTFDPLSLYALSLEQTDASVTPQQRAAAASEKTIALAAGNDNVFVFGNKESIYEKYSGKQALNLNSSLYISSDMLTSLFNFSLAWDDTGMICTGTIGTDEYIFDLNKKTVSKNGGNAAGLIPAERIGDRTYFSLRAAAEAAKMTVKWDERGFAAVSADASAAENAEVRDLIYNILIGG